MTIISGLMTVISGCNRELERFDEFSSVILAFLSRFGPLRMHTEEFYDAACAVVCVSELRGRETLNHLKRTSYATGMSIQPETPQKIRPELRLDVRD